jgi:3-phosphoshikimate 1-carboxyvinyltransferase
VTVRFDSGARLRGTITPPADKSISHRAAIVGAMASQPVRVTRSLPSSR